MKSYRRTLSSSLRLLVKLGRGRSTEYKKEMKYEVGLQKLMRSKKKRKKKKTDDRECKPVCALPTKLNSLVVVAHRVLDYVLSAFFRRVLPPCVHYGDKPCIEVLPAHR